MKEDQDNWYTTIHHKLYDNTNIYSNNRKQYQYDLHYHDITSNCGRNSTDQIVNMTNTNIN